MQVFDELGNLEVGSWRVSAWEQGQAAPKCYGTSRSRTKTVAALRVLIPNTPWSMAWLTWREAACKLAKQQQLHKTTTIKQFS